MRKLANIYTFDPAVLELDGNLKRSEVIELLADLRFSRQPGATHSIVVDKDVRDLLVHALRRK
jgi:hypothetical protein